MTRPAIGYCMTVSGELVDIVLLSETASDPAPTPAELELVRMCKEWKELKAENSKLKGQIHSIASTGCGPAYLDKVDLAKLKGGKHYHDLHCNVSREHPMGCDGCSCTMYKRALKAERFVCPFQRPEFKETNKGDLQDGQ